MRLSRAEPLPGELEGPAVLGCVLEIARAVSGPPDTSRAGVGVALQHETGACLDLPSSGDARCLASRLQHNGIMMKIQRVSSFVLGSLLFTVAGAVPVHAESTAGSPEASTISVHSTAAQGAPLGGGRGSEASGSAAQEAESIVPRFALGVNSPTGWLRGSFGASLSMGLDRHHAVRASVARYDPEPLLLVLITQGESAPIGGAILDLGLGWVYYPRRLWDGFMLEAGALRRARAVRVLGFYGDTATRSVTYGGRATVGWSWPITRYGFVSAAVGISVGRETGEETFTPEVNMSTITALDRVQVAPEVHVRFGFRFGR